MMSNTYNQEIERERRNTIELSLYHCTSSELSEGSCRVCLREVNIRPKSRGVRPSVSVQWDPVASLPGASCCLRAIRRSAPASPSTADADARGAVRSLSTTDDGVMRWQAMGGREFVSGRCFVDLRKIRCKIGAGCGEVEEGMS